MFSTKYANVQPCGTISCSYMDPDHYNWMLSIFKRHFLWKTVCLSLKFILRIKILQREKLWKMLSENEQVFNELPDEIWVNIVKFVIN